MQSSVRGHGTRFGAFEVELRSGEVYKHGIRLKLQEQPFQVLALLLEHPGDVVTREELRQKLWPADTFVDFDTGLNSAIKKLRDVLGDSADEPRYIETLLRRGETAFQEGQRTSQEAHRCTLFKHSSVETMAGLLVLPQVLGNEQNRKLKVRAGSFPISRHR